MNRAGTHLFHARKFAPLSCSAILRAVRPCLVLILSFSAMASAQNDPPRDLLLMGSSSVNGALGRQIEYELENLGLNVIRRGRGSSGFARPDFLDMQAQIDELGPLQRYRAILLIAGGNDTQSRLLRPEER